MNETNVARWFADLCEKLKTDLVTRHGGLGIPVWVNPWKWSAFSHSAVNELLGVDVFSFVARHINPYHVSKAEMSMTKRPGVDLYHAVFRNRELSDYKKVVFEVYEEGVIIYSATGKTRSRAITNFFSNAESDLFISQMVTDMIGRVIQKSILRKKQRAARLIQTVWLTHALRPGGRLAERAGHSFYKTAAEVDAKQ